MRFVKYKKKKALTLIEVVISIALLTIVMIPIATMAIHSTKVNKKAENNQQGTIIAQKLMEKINSLSEFQNQTLDDGIILEKDITTSEYKIKGTTEGFKVEGSINPSAEYKGEQKDDTNTLVTGGTVILPKNEAANSILVDGDVVIGKPLDFSIIRESDGINIITSNGTKKIITDKSALEVIAEKGSVLKYNIKVSNNTKDSFALYCYKYKDSSALINIENKKGKILYYNNLIKQDSAEGNKEVTRLYDINIKVSKGDSNYEIKFNKAMVK